MDDLRLAIVECINIDVNDKPGWYMTKYKDLFDKYPHILKKACEPGFDLEKFDWMVKMLDSVHSDEISKHNADIVVGERLVDEHIKSKLG